MVKPYRDANKLAWSEAPYGQGYLRNEEILFCPEEQISNLAGAAAYGQALSDECPFKFTTLGTVRNPDQPSLPIPFKSFISPSCSVLGGDCGEMVGDEYRHYSGILDTDKPYITLRHKNLANIFLADGHVTSVERDLKDYYFYSIRGSSSKDKKFATVIKQRQKFDL